MVDHVDAAEPEWEGAGEEGSHTADLLQTQAPAKGSSIKKAVIQILCIYCSYCTRFSKFFQL